MPCLLLFIVFCSIITLLKMLVILHITYFHRLKILSCPRVVLLGMIAMLFWIPLFLSCFYGVSMFVSQADYKTNISLLLLSLLLHLI